VQEAFDRAQAGNIIHVNPGLYFVREDGIRTKRSGEAGKPITLTGPPEAVLTVADGVTNRLPILLVRHSHIRVSGMTFDGLGDRDPIGPPAFAHSLINCLPLPGTDAYLKGLTISPDAIGNALGAGISLTRVKHSKVGGFELIGPIGVEYLQFERTEPIGEVVYVGTALETLNSDWYPGENPDLTSNIQIEHIDNSAGYSHSELVNTKLGTHDVTIEYCSDIGGAQAGDAGWIMGAVNISGRSTVVRGCELSNHDIHGVKIGASAARKGTNPHPIVSDAGTNNSVYGNRLMNNSGKAVKFLFGNQNSDDQTVLCGNKYNGRTDGNPGKKCPENNCGGPNW